MSKFNIYHEKDAGEECWRWRLTNTNNKIIAISEEAFIKSSIVRSIKTIQEKVSKNTPVYLDESKEDVDKGYRFEYSEDKKYLKNQKERWYWRLKSGNNEIMAISSKRFDYEKEIEDSINNFKVEITKAEILWDNPEDDPSNDAKNEDDTKADHSIPPGS